MYIVNLTLWDRLQLDLCIPRNAPIREIKQLLRIADVVAPTQEEWEAIGYTVVTVQSQGGPVDIPNWTVNSLETWEMAHGPVAASFESEDMTKLRGLVGQRQTWPTDVRTLELQEKINNAEEQ
jgi:hypothetical protein